MTSLRAMARCLEVGQLWRGAVGVLTVALLFLSIPTDEAAAQASKHSGDTVVLQGGGGEVYIAGLPAGWTLGFQESNEIGHHLEWVPQGQPVKDWRDMIAFQLFPKLIDIEPDHFLVKMADHYAQSCDQVLATDIEGTPANGYPGAIRVLACTKNKVTGLGEITLFRAVMGQEAFYVAQRAWRMAPFSAEAIPVTGEQLDSGRKLIEYGLACRSNNPNRPCPPGWDRVLSSLDSNQPSIVYKANGG